MSSGKAQSAHLVTTPLESYIQKERHELEKLKENLQSSIIKKNELETKLCSNKSIDNSVTCKQSCEICHFRPDQNQKGHNRLNCPNKDFPCPSPEICGDTDKHFKEKGWEARENCTKLQRKVAECEQNLCMRMALCSRGLLECLRERLELEPPSRYLTGMNSFAYGLLFSDAKLLEAYCRKQKTANANHLTDLRGVMLNLDRELNSTKCYTFAKEISCAGVDSISTSTLNTARKKDEGVMRLWKLKRLGTYPSSVDEEEYQLKFALENSEHDQMETAADALVLMMSSAQKEISE